MLRKKMRAEALAKDAMPIKCPYRVCLILRRRGVSKPSLVPPKEKRVSIS